VLKRLKISGYVQAQFQYADSSGQPAAGGNFPAGTDKRFMVRRGRVKFQYNGAPNAKDISVSQYVLQFDVTERGMTIKDAYAKLTDPWTGWFSVTAGLFSRPFGFEIGYSSSLRESPERARAIGILFPGEREVGAMLTIQAPKSSMFHPLKIDAGLFNGNGAPGPGGDVSDFDKKKDFIGRLSVDRSMNNDKTKMGAGISFYDGGYRIDSVNVYKNATDLNGANGFIIQNTAAENAFEPLVKRAYTQRRYFGVDAQFTFDWYGGVSALRGEYIMGEQPGFAADTRSPNDKSPVTKDIYNRNFNAGIFYLVHTVAQTGFTIVAKYDWYDPNTEVEKNEIGKSTSGDVVSTNATDLRYSTFGGGFIYALDANLKLTAYYDIVTNEFSQNLSGYTKDRKDNLFTLRMQVKF
jgi:hypothetical protein